MPKEPVTSGEAGQVSEVVEPLEIYANEEVTIFFHEHIPLVSYLPSGRVILTTDGHRIEKQRLLINKILNKEILSKDWTLPDGRPLEDGMIFLL